MNISNNNIELITSVTQEDEYDLESDFSNLALDLYEESNDFFLTETEKSKDNKIKNRLHSEGFYYLEDKYPNNGKIHWKCEQSNCKGRVHTFGKHPPVRMVMNHTHLPDFNRHGILVNISKLKERAKIGKENPRSIIIDVNLRNTTEVAAGMIGYDAARQVINSQRRGLDGYGRDAKDLSKVIIPAELQITYKGEEFYFDDSGSDDEARIIMFCTPTNINLLEINRDWYSDGTFLKIELKLRKHFFHLNIQSKSRNSLKLSSLNNLQLYLNKKAQL